MRKKSQNQSSHLLSMRDVVKRGVGSFCEGHLAVSLTESQILSLNFWHLHFVHLNTTAAKIHPSAEKVDLQFTALSHPT